MGPTTTTTAATTATTKTTIATASPFELAQQELIIVMESVDGKPSKASTPKKSRPVPDIPDINLPFPPTISALEIFEKSLEKSNHKSNVTKSLTNFADKKAPNCFLIYRKIFVEVLHQLNFNLSMTDISGAIAKKWKEEPKHVKEVYQKIATEIDDLRKQRFGTDSRKKSKKSQGRTFSAPINNNHNNANNTYPSMSNDIYDGNLGNLQHNFNEHLDPSSYPFGFDNSINNISTTHHIPQQQYMYSSDFLHPHLSQPQSIYLNNLNIKPDPSYPNYMISNNFHTSVVN